MSTEHEMRMPFGKHRGVAVAEIPESYLRWLHETVSLREPLKTAVAVALKGKAASAVSGAGNTTLETRNANVGHHTQQAARSMGSQRTFQGQEAAKPKRTAWRRPEDEDLSQYYSNGADDGIGF
jgi:hypothetical protein